MNQALFVLNTVIAGICVVASAYQKFYKRNTEEATHELMWAVIFLLLAQK